MAKEKFPKKIITLLKSIKNKRAKVVIDSILKHGSISTETLEKKYGYNHPPRAARDVREAGIPLETFTISSSDGRKIAAYRFGDFSKIQKDKLGGRKIFSKKFKNALYAHYKGKCVVCNSTNNASANHYPWSFNRSCGHDVDGCCSITTGKLTCSC